MHSPIYATIYRYMYFVVFDTCFLLNNIHNLFEIPSSIAIFYYSFLIFIIKSLLINGGLPRFLAYLLVLLILYRCIFYTICRPMLLIYVVLGLQIRDAVFVC